MDKKNVLDIIFTKYQFEDEIDEEILISLREAIMEMEVAEAMFNSVSDDKLIEAAIYRQDAAKKKFEFILSLAKEKHLKNTFEG